ncbi:hypothetical protein ACIREO_14145 [Streptomyces sp. NPDC102441]|uniref:hypothetical protein n=1 Tax=Streptomyces sp. NPDC102441 TaxID=3366176 RepID=UPI0038233EA1
MADDIEIGMLAAATYDATSGMEIADDDDADPAALRLALRYVCRSAQDAVKVAELRAERLPETPGTGPSADLLRDALAASLRKPLSGS